MAFYNSPSEVCQASIQRLNEAGLEPNPRSLGKKIGMLDWLMSDANPQTINSKQIDNSEQSDYRPVRLEYFQRQNDNDVVEDDASVDCSQNEHRRKRIATYEPDLFAESKFTISEKYFREVICEQNIDTFVQDHLDEAMRVIRENIDKQLFTKAGNQMGANPAANTSAGTYQSVQMLNSDGTLNSNSWDTIRNQMEDNYFAGTPVGLVGLGHMRDVMNRLAVGAANDGGVNFEEVMNQFGMSLFKDHWTNTALGNANNILAFIPGYAQFYQYLLNQGDFAIEINQQSVKGTFPDPVVPGLKYDYFVKYDDNCSTGNGHQGAYIWRLWTYFDLFTPPDDLFDVYDELGQMNGIFGYQITQA